MKIVKEQEYLLINLEEYSDFLSWCVHNGGASKGKSIYWAKVEEKDLSEDICVNDYLREKWNKLKIKPDLAFITSADIKDLVYKKYTYHDLEVEVIATTGLGNALRVGDPSGFYTRLGTINILVEINKPLSSSAMVEAICIATEAKTAAVIEMGVKSKVSLKAATGTGTDCIAIASKNKTEIENEYIYSGKHTKLGELIGKACFDVVTIGIKRWKNKNE